MPEVQDLRTVVVAITSTIVAIVAAGCGSAPLGGDLEADTARIELGDRRLVVDLDHCGQDGDAVFIVGRRAGVILQAVLHLEDGPDASGVSVDLAPDEGVGAFGVDAAPALGAAVRGPVGEVTHVETDGDRAVIEADVVTIGPGLEPTQERRGRLRVVARCPEDVPQA